MICARCDKPIARGQAEKRSVEQGSGGGGTVWLHKTLCSKRLTGRTYSPPRV
ncbi:hypothetical protein GCM10011583_12190 [Streptomyces camponoticapitis]|uniref:DUF448 domain-containing protein n=1 Tax=Streptomyces camponoticapitis TaxID=1616125 RepID=A0ABQ2E3D4_9ACTN|nr:hypothetical protein GCM10011583_12190 [Streptomyces camponoticapitis]